MGGAGKPRTSGKLQIAAPPGALADNPEGVFRAIVAAAAVDGAGADWVDRMVKASGGTRKTVAVNGRLKFRLLQDALSEQQRIYAASMEEAVVKIGKILDRAAEEADPPVGV